jgi:ATP-binding protein involved in chromosome partitioning
MMGQGAVEHAAQDYDVPYLGSLPMDPAIMGFSDQGTPFVIAAPESEASKAFIEMAHKVFELIGD